ncbi:MAG: hypothetical protein JWP58_1066 [Hymenobacter sp.]|nr:hypothetical protein [Hymenobacter sp.]
MSIETLTTDEFMELTVQEHEEALSLYAEAIVKASASMQDLEVGTIAHEDCLDRIARLCALRKVHKVRLEEINEDAAEAAEMNGATAVATA